MADREHIKRIRAEEAAIGKEIIQVVVGEPVVYIPLNKMSPEYQEKVRYVYKVNELILAAIRQRVEDAIGPSRLAVLLVPTKYEYGMDMLPPPAECPGHC